MNGNFVHHNCRCTSVYRLLSYPLRSLCGSHFLQSFTKTDGKFTFREARPLIVKLEFDFHWYNGQGFVSTGSSLELPGANKKIY